MFGDIEAIPCSINGQNDKIAGILTELSNVFNGEFNPNTEVSGNLENGFTITGGGTFVPSSDVQAGLSEQLDKIYSSSVDLLGSADSIEGGAYGNKSKETKVLKQAGKAIKKVNDEYINLSQLVQEKIQNIDAIKEMLHKGFNKLYELAKSDESNEIAKANIKSAEDKIFAEFDRQLGILQNILKMKIKPTQKDLLDLLKKNQDFTTLSETFGIAYGDETASDRLALVFTNMSDITLMAKKVKDALKDLNISMNEYKNIKNSGELYNELYKVFKNFNKKKLDIELPRMLEAMNILKNSQGSHDNILKELSGSSSIKSQIRAAGDDSDKEHSSSSSSSDSESSSSSSSSDEENTTKDEIEGGDYTTELSRKRKNKLNSSLSKRVQTYQKTMKELYKSFMNQVNRNFKELSILIDLLSNKIGSEIAYDDDLRDFINMFKGFNEDIDNEKIFYSLIGLDVTVAGRELKARFGDTLNKIIDSASKLKNYKIFNDINLQLKNLNETIDTMFDTVNNLKKSEAEKTGSSDFMWTDKLVEQSFSMNNIKLIKDSIKKLSFYGKVSTIKENLHRMNKEQKLYQEDYDKLLGKSIGLKLTELQKEYVENVDRLNDKQRGRGRLLEEHNSTYPVGNDRHLPRGLVETIYKLQYEAKEGLYKSLEAIDLYLMYFTESLSAHPEAVMDLNKMLEQTDIIAKWFTKQSVDNLIKLFESDSVKPVNPITSADYPDLNLPNILANEPIVQNRIKEAFEATKKCIDSISVLKNILSIFIHLGEKYGNTNLTDKLHISPNMIYKHLVKYIWVSAFTMGYATGGGDKTVANKDTVAKGLYEPENGDINSFFDVLFTTIILPLDIYKEVETKIDILKSTTTPKEQAVVDELNKRFKKDIFIIDDRYFILALKAMVGKIFTVVDTHSLLHTPDNLANVMKNPVRMIIGANSNPDIISDAIELYIRLPLLVEFYKSIFEDGNKNYKNNEGKDDETEIIAYIPELGTVWSGLIQCIFDESKYIKDGLYSINNMKDIVNEVNKIYSNYKSTSKDKLVRTIVLDLIAEINRRYGILKKKEIAEFYQVKKKYIKNVVDSKFEDNVNFDILNENNEYERAGPSSQYVETTFNKSSDDSLVFTDIKLVRNFRNKIYNALFKDDSTTQDLSSKSFNEKIKYYKKQINSTESKEQKFELIAQAIDQSSNINAYNVDAYLLFNELVLDPINSLDKTYNKYIEILQKFMNYNKNVGLTFNLTNPLEIIKNMYQYFNDAELCKIKMISNTKFIIDYSNLQTIVELYIENIKYMISKFRNLICKDLIKTNEEKLYRLENNFLNILIKDDSSSENFDDIGMSFELLNQKITEIMTTQKNYNLQDLYHHIMIGSDKAKILASSIAVQRTQAILTDITKYYDATTRAWVSHPTIEFYDYLIPNDNIKNYKSFEKKSILQKFNMFIFAYLDQFYNSSTKKVYSKLFDEFANKAMSATIFEQGGIPDMSYGNVTLPTLDYPKILNNSVLSSTNVTILRTLLTRTLNIQLPVKYHLVDNINEVSSVQLEKYRAYLPLFITYFEHLIQECVIYKKLLDNSDLTVNNLSSPPIASGFSNTELKDDTNTKINYTTNLSQGASTIADYKSDFHEILNNVINGSRAIINDATNVLNELNFVPQFGNIRENFIKNFYNNNLQLPYMPISLVSKVLEQPKNINILPIHSINSNLNKYIYGTNFVLHNLNKEKEEDINNYLWLKEQLKVYNNSSLSTNSIDAKKVNQFLTLHKKLILSNYLNTHVKSNLYYNDTTNLTSDLNITEDISNIENQLNDNKKHELIKKFTTKICSTSLDSFNLERQKAIILNVIDLNVNPINIHALMREVPLVNIYNYAFTFDNMIKNMISNVNPDELYAMNNTLTETYNDKLVWLSCLLQDPYFIDYKNKGTMTSKDIIDNALQIVNQPTSFNKDNNLYLSKPKYTTNFITSLTDEINKSTSKLSSKLKDKEDFIYNNKFFRNILFLVNLQRVIRLKVKNAVYKINTNVVSDTNILNMRITEYPTQETKIDDNEFEITDLF